jgi:periplasmic divalent cation tolerance protein
MSTAIVIVLTTVSNETEAQTLADHLINKHLAACVQYSVGSSCYRWRGTVRHDQEVMLRIKTYREKIPAIQALMDLHHPYELPEFVMLDGEAGAFYGKWMRGELS